MPSKCIHVKKKKKKKKKKKCENNDILFAVRITTDFDKYELNNQLSRVIAFPTGLYGAPSEDSDQPAHPCSLIRVFSVHLKTL